jgi:replication fork protection complex subunit Tof1/Swi1
VGEDGEVTRFYRPGDSIVGCLRDLKKLWRKDDTDDERTVARIISKSGIIRDLVAIVEEVSDRGPWGMKVGLMAGALPSCPRVAWPSCP